jgi:hypothetical protein
LISINYMTFLDQPHSFLKYIAPWQIPCKQPGCIPYLYALKICKLEIPSVHKWMQA